MARPIIKGDDLIVDTEFYKWLQTEQDAGRKHVRFVDALLEYFDTSQPFKKRGDMFQHKVVFEAFWRNNLK